MVGVILSREISASEEIQPDFVALDCDIEGCNLYGCQVCPSCKSPDRYSCQDIIICTNCKFQQTAVFVRGEQ